VFRENEQKDADRFHVHTSEDSMVMLPRRMGSTLLCRISANKMVQVQFWLKTMASQGHYHASKSRPLRKMVVPFKQLRFKRELQGRVKQRITKENEYWQIHILSTEQ
jgi:hypothetical protein